MPSPPPPDAALAALMLNDSPEPTCAPLGTTPGSLAEAYGQSALTTQSNLQAVRAEAETDWRFPSARVRGALHVVQGGRLRLLDPMARHSADGALPPNRFVRVIASRSLLICDGAKAATLLGALPGLSLAGSRAVCGSALGDVNAESRGVRFILRSFELDALAPSAAEADAWVSKIPPRCHRAPPHA